MARLAGKVAIVTGAGTGIGRCTAELFAREGAKVVIAEIDTPSGEETAHRIARAGGDAIFWQTDVSEPKHRRHRSPAPWQHYGGLHVLHNNAGGSTSIDSTVVDAPLEEFWRAIKLDLFGTFLGCRFGIPELIRSGRRLDHQHGLRRRADGVSGARLLHRGQGRRRRASPARWRSSSRRRSDPGQRHRPGRHAAPTACAAAGRQSGDGRPGRRSICSGSASRWIWRTPRSTSPPTRAASSPAPSFPSIAAW